jgi:catechol 2,3-dioxygenase-like lactoylglutathione lyase family enzyme
MPVTRLNHAVLFVRDVERSVAFYRDLLDFKVVNEMPGAAFLQASASNNDHDLGLFQVGPAAGPSLAGRQTVGLYHLAWEVDTLDELERIAGWPRPAP